jgi:hypothetical protein
MEESQLLPIWMAFWEVVPILACPKESIINPTVGELMLVPGPWATILDPVAVPPVPVLLLNVFILSVPVILPAAGLAYQDSCKALIPARVGS